MIRVAFADDKAVNRRAFAARMARLPDITLLFIAEGGHDCLEQLKGLPSGHLPQVLFLDLDMPGLDGVQTLRLVKSVYPELPCIMLTVFDDEDKIFDAIHAGASGYLLKDESAEALSQAIKETLDFGGAPMSPAIARKALYLLSQADRPSAKQKQEMGGTDLRQVLLTQREQEVLQHSISGLDPKGIAEALNISVWTVRKHIDNIYAKLHLNSRTQLMSMAYRNNWL